MLDSPSDDILESEALELTVTSADQFLPALTLDEARERYKVMREFISEQMVEGVDYGRFGGVTKSTLLKPGAEKLTTLFGLRVIFVPEKTVENWGGEGVTPLFHYQRKCQLWKGNVLIAEASGSANSWEGRYRWRWVKEQDLTEPPPDAKVRDGKTGIFKWQYEKRVTTGQYGKPETYWKSLDGIIADKASLVIAVQPWDNKEAEYYEWGEKEYRIPNDDIYSLVNTILKMAEKRALVAATLIAVNASDYFTQDMEDIVEGVEVTKSVAQKEAVKKDGETPESAIANALAIIKEGTFSGNDFLHLSKVLGYDQGEVMEVKRKYETRDAETKKVLTNFQAAAQELIDRYKEVSS